MVKLSAANTTAYRAAEQGSAPATPTSGFALIYPKGDGRWYQKDDAGTERLLAGPADAPAAHKASHEVGGGDAFTGAVPGSSFAPGGLTGATQASRYVGATASGAPASGTFAVGDFVIDRSGSLWVCTTAGSPGTWAEIGAGGGAALTVREVDGSPSVAATELVLPNGTLGVVGTVATYTPSGSGGGGQELGYAEITAAVSTTSSSYVDISGLSVAVTIGSRPVRVKFLATLAQHDVAASGVRTRFQIYDTTAGAVVLEAQQTTNNSNGALFVMDARHAPASGSRTYKVQWKVIDAGTMNLQLMTAGQVVAYIQVEEL